MKLGKKLHQHFLLNTGNASTYGWSWFSSGLVCVAGLGCQVVGAGEQLLVVWVPGVQLSTGASEQLSSTSSDCLPLMVLDKITEGVVRCLMGAEEGVLAASDVNKVVAAAIGGPVGDRITPDALTHPHQKAANSCL